MLPHFPALLLLLFLFLLLFLVPSGGADPRPSSPPPPPSSSSAEEKEEEEEQQQQQQRSFGDSLRSSGLSEGFLEEAGGGGGGSEGFSGRLPSNVARFAKSGRSFSPKPRDPLQNRPSGQRGAGEHNEENGMRGEVPPSRANPKCGDSWRGGNERRKRRDVEIPGTEGESGKGSVSEAGRAGKDEAGGREEASRDQPREERDAEEEAKKSGIGLCEGHYEAAVGRGKRKRGFHDGENGGEASWPEDEAGSGNLDASSHGLRKGNEAVDDDAEGRQREKSDGSSAGEDEEEDEDEDEEAPSVRPRMRRWSWVPRPNPVRNRTRALPTRYSRIFAKNFPQIFSNYHDKRSSRQGDQRPRQGPALKGGDDPRAVASPKPDRKGGRSLALHALRAKGGNKRARGERAFEKAPQQRHARSRNRAKRKVPAKEVWALAGDAALLPCDLRIRQPKDSVQMVMWLKEGTHTPLFSVDYREQAGGRPQVWRDNTASTARRAYLHMADVDVGVTGGAPSGRAPRPRGMGGDVPGGANFRFFGDRIEDVGGSSSSSGSAEEGEASEEEAFGLVVRDVELNDSAVYRCRVDFLLSPTRNTRVNLTVVVPPLRVGVRWWLGDRGDSDIDGHVGPFREGDSPSLICYTRDAWPPPRVVWFEEDALVDDSYSTDALNEAVENTLNLEHLTRAHHRRRFTCVAANSNLTRPIAATVRLQMALDVLAVQMDDVGVLSAGVQAEVKCTVLGSSPPPNVTWTLAGMVLPSSKPWVSDDGNRSVSMVNFTPQPRHDGTQLECSAHNPAIVGVIPHSLPPADHRHSTLLSINYAPRVSISLGRSLDASNIKEGDDLYFECSAIAKPPPHKVTWSHNGQPLDSSAGVLVSNMTLVLQKVSRSNAGSYTCHATNVEGSAASPPLHLDIKYAPVCASDKISQYSVAKQENARISCNVLANPPVVHFSWAFNNTAEAVSVPSDRYVVMGTESVVNYTPVTELDYGTLLCLATNDIGQQVHPCVFQIVAAGKPDPPHNCRAYDVTISSLQVSCLPGDDGGLGQTFLLQVLEANGDYKPVVEVTRETASFSVANLRPATAYRLLVTATNAKGKSRSAELRAYTVALNHPQHETPAEPTRGRESGPEVAVGVLVGAVLACLPVAIAVVVVGVRTCIRLRAARRGRGEDSEKEASEMEGGGGGSSGRPLLSGQGTPGSVGGVSVEGGTDITTITGGVALASALPPTPSSAQADGRPSQVSAAEAPSLLYPGSRLYSPDRTQETTTTTTTTTMTTTTTGPPGGSSSSSLRRSPYSPTEEKFAGGGGGGGDGELLEITLPPPAAYDQGYQSPCRGGCQPQEQCYRPQERGPLRLEQKRQQAFREYQEAVLPPAAYPSAKGGGHHPHHPHHPPPHHHHHHPSLQYISSSALGQDYRFPDEDPAFAALPGGGEAVATASPPPPSSSSSFAALPRREEEAAPDADPKMSTLYNPLALFASSPGYFPEKCAPAAAAASPHTGSLKRGVRPQVQDVLRIRESARNRSASLSSVASKRESSV